jgi:hypothetical protein
MFGSTSQANDKKTLRAGDPSSISLRNQLTLSPVALMQTRGNTH